MRPFLALLLCGCTGYQMVPGATYHYDPQTGDYTYGVGVTYAPPLRLSDTDREIFRGRGIRVHTSDGTPTPPPAEQPPTEPGYADELAAVGGWADYTWWGIALVLVAGTPLLRIWLKRKAAAMKDAA